MRRVSFARGAEPGDDGGKRVTVAHEVGRPRPLPLRVDLGPTAYATIALATIFLGFVSPGVPRGAFLMLAPLFLSIGLPIEGIGILIAVDAIPDLFATVLNASGDLAATVIVDRR